MVNVQIICPVCKKKGNIEVSEDSMKEFSRGILAINIAEKTICKDSFVAYLDKNLKVRDYFIVDFKLELPDFISEKDKKLESEKKFIVEKILDLDLIKYNMSPNLLAYTLKVILLGKKFLLILDDQQSFLIDHLINFYKYITQNSFKYELNIILQKEYNDKKKNYKDYIVFDNKEIIYDRDKFLNPKKIAVEKRIIQKFIAETDQNLSLLIIKNDIQKAFDLSKFVTDYLNKVESIKKIDITEIYKDLQEQFHTNISSIYLSFLLEIVENYHKVEIPGSLKRLLKIIF